MLAGARRAQATRSIRLGITDHRPDEKAVTERVIPRPEDSYHIQRLTARSLHDICATLRYSIQSQHTRCKKFEIASSELYLPSFIPTPTERAAVHFRTGLALHDGWKQHTRPCMPPAPEELANDIQDGQDERFTDVISLKEMPPPGQDEPFTDVTPPAAAEGSPPGISPPQLHAPARFGKIVM